MMTLMYDPPSGWRYGFPRPYLPIEGETLAETLVREGYPAKEAEFGAKHCRFMGCHEELDALNADHAARQHVEGLSEKSIQTSDNDNFTADDARRAVGLSNSRRGDWLQLYSGKQFWPMDPRADDVEIEDIAHSLSMQCRYGGHSLRFYSVAEHCVLMTRWVQATCGPNADAAIYTLLHDASEAYLADVPRPLKRHLPGYADAEARVMAAVCERYELESADGWPPIVHEADTRILADEVRQNMRPMEWHLKHDDPLGVELQFWTPEQAKAKFLALFMSLQRKRQQDVRAQDARRVA